MAGRRKKSKSEASSSSAVGRRKKPKLNASSPAAPPSPPWLELPWDITANILLRLGVEEILETAQKVCTTWRSVCKHPSMWRKIHLSRSRESSRRVDFEIMCRHAVDRSHGQLLDVELSGFGTNSLMNYISERSSKLLCLSLVYCDDISGLGLAEAAKGWPLLEELSLTLFRIDAEYVEQIGRACPALKSLSIYKPIVRRWLIKYDTEAPGIAKSMTQLRHLRLNGNRMLSKDLLAILDGCPHLESLHLEVCINLCVDNELAKRLSQIKRLTFIKYIPVNPPGSRLRNNIDQDYLDYLTSR